VPDNSDKLEAKPKRKLRLGRLLLVSSLILLGLTLWINGPGSRWLLRKLIIEQLADRGLVGDTAVSGQLWNGYQLENTFFTGSGSLILLKADHLSVRYRLSDLFLKKIDLVEARGVRVTLYPESSQEETGNWKDAFETLRTLQPLVTPIKIDLQDILINLHLEGQEPREISLDSLAHASGSEAFILNGFSPGKILNDPAAKQDLALQWTASSLALAQFTIVPELEIADLSLTYAEGDPITARTELGLGDSTLTIKASEDGDARVELNESPLDLAQLAKLGELIDLPQPVTGTIEHLDVTAIDLLGPPSEWHASVAITTRQVFWQQRQLPDVVLDATLSPKSWQAQLKLAGEALTMNVDAPPVDTEGKWWTDLPVTLALECPSLATAVDLYQRASGEELTGSLPNGALATKGVITFGSKTSVRHASFDWQGTELTLNERVLPDLKGTVSLDGQTLALTTTRSMHPAGEELAVEASYHLTDKTYQAAATINLKESEWLGRLLIPERPAMYPIGPLILHWSGSGALGQQTHRGNYHLETLTARIPDETTTNASLKGSYQWPGAVNAESIVIRNGQLELAGGITWTRRRTSFHKLQLTHGDGVLATINGSGPGGTGFADLPITEIPFDLKIKAKDLNLARLRSLLPITLDPAYRATFNADLALTGTPNKPKLNGSLSTTGILTPNEKIPALAFTTNFETTEGQLELSGSLTEPGGQLATFEANIPVEAEKWANDPALFNEIPISASVLVTELSLDRLQIFSPALKEAEGLFNLNLTLTGTTSEPVYHGSAEAILKKFPLPSTPYQAIYDTKVRINFDKDRLTLEPSSMTIAGGTLALSGQAELSGLEPVLDFRLDADHALLWRNDIFIARTSGQLNLKGPWKSARLSGQLGIVDSLFYKDIEIISLTKPSATVNAPELPKFSKGKITDLSFDLPAPIRDWPVDIDITTQDPILVRGNLATGEAKGDISIRGTVSNPLPEGKIGLSAIELVLPFSTLKISRGSILLRPESPLDPLLEFRGSSAVNSTAINIYVFGPVSNPKYNLSSDPPLPESELLSLLATGATTADLDDPALAQARLFQLLVDETRRKANSDAASPMLKIFREPLNAVQQLNLRVAENDPFSGRKFNSATMKLSSKWSGVMQIDDEGNTRGLLHYSLRSK